MAAAALFAVAASEARDGFSVERAELRPIGGVYVLDGDARYAFSADSIEALANGVPLTLVIRCTVDRERRFWWNERIADFRERLDIRYHPLGKLYLMQYSDRGPAQSYASLEALLAEMGSIRGVPVMPASRVEADQRYRASLSIWLDIEALPLPLRPFAYLSPSWYLGSPAYRWSFEKSD
ncbi:MAG: DUF4390 domain-containing protein [Methylotetracoccus sp.]